MAAKCTSKKHFVLYVNIYQKRPIRLERLFYPTDHIVQDDITTFAALAAHPTARTYRLVLRGLEETSRASFLHLLALDLMIDRTTSVYQ